MREILWRPLVDRRTQVPIADVRSPIGTSQFADALERKIWKMNREFGAAKFRVADFHPAVVNLDARFYRHQSKART